MYKNFSSCLNKTFYLRIKFLWLNIQQCLFYFSNLTLLFLFITQLFLNINQMDSLSNPNKLLSIGVLFFSCETLSKGFVLIVNDRAAFRNWQSIKKKSMFWILWIFLMFQYYELLFPSYIRFELTKPTKKWAIRHLHCTTNLKVFSPLLHQVNP